MSGFVERCRAWSSPLTCAEFAAAMRRAGQDRDEIRERLTAMDRWSAVTIYHALPLYETCAVAAKRLRATGATPREMRRLLREAGWVAPTACLAVLALRPNSNAGVSRFRSVGETSPRPSP